MPMQAKTLAFTGMAPCSRQLRSVGPNWGWFSSQRSSRGDERAKQAAARMRNGVVGNSGRKAPTKPTATSTQPAAKKAGRFTAARLELGRRDQFVDLLGLPVDHFPHVLGVHAEGAGRLAD